MAIQCTDIEPLAQTYLDGELAGHDVAELEAHLDVCEACHAHLDDEAGFRRVLQRHLVTPEAPEALHARIRLMLDEEDEVRVHVKRRQRWSWVLPGSATFAAAAALVLFVVQPGKTERSSSMAGAATEVGYEAVKSHIERPPMQVQGAAVSPWIKQHLAPRVQVPRFRGGVDLLGARLSQLRGRKSAQLFYKIDQGNRQQEVQLHILLGGSGHHVLGPVRYRVRGTDVWIDRRSGYNIARFESAQGTQYLFTSPMEVRELLEFIQQSDLLNGR